MRLLDEQYLKTPFYGSRHIKVFLNAQGYTISRKRVQRLMRALGISAVYPKPRLSQRNMEHRVYPYLLRGMNITSSNQVWCTDITYLPVLKGHSYLVAIMDWFSRRVLSWKISNTLDLYFYLDALRESLDSFGLPHIFNSDRGSQFNSRQFTQYLLEFDIKISMDRRGRCYDNIFIERLWRSLKYELIYIKEFHDLKHLNDEVDKWFYWYNQYRPHQALDYQTPEQVYRDGLPSPEVA